MSRHHVILSLAATCILAGTVSAQTTLETFETFAGLGFGASVGLNVNSLNENTIANGQGPGLVLDGCTYSGSVSLQWNGAGYFGAASQAILSDSGDGWIEMIYDSPVSTMSVELLAFNGFSDTAIVTIYDFTTGLPIFTSSAIAVPDANGVPFAHTAANIGKLRIQGVRPWSLIIDNHEFGGARFSLAKTGSCPGATTLTSRNGTAGGAVAILYGNAGSFTKNGNPCNGLTLGIANPTLAAMRTANGAGTATLAFIASPGACGRTVQAVDVGSCTASNTVVL